MLGKLKVLAVIPARLASTRLPNKPLILVKGKPLIYYTYHNLRSPFIDKKIVATDSEKIIAKVEEFGGEAILTKNSHPNGSERVAEVAEKFNDYDIILNIQGDEPMVSGEAIEKLLIPFTLRKEIVMTTLKTKISFSEAQNPNTVKVVTSKENLAIYFSRSPIPYYAKEETQKMYYKHLGLYAFRRDYLFRYIQLPSSFLEKAESLEQLRVLENHDSIYVDELAEDLIDINTKKDIERFNNSNFFKNQK